MPKPENICKRSLLTISWNAIYWLAVCADAMDDHDITPLQTPETYLRMDPKGDYHENVISLIADSLIFQEANIRAH
jgi:hypothetical protein